MAITDELRQYASYAATDRFKQSMLAIADRIDAEHEEAISKQSHTICIPLSEEAMAEDGWHRFVDAEGVPIWFGDKVTVPWSIKLFEVTGFSYTENLTTGKKTVWVDVYDKTLLRNTPLCSADSCYHLKPDTWERVINDAFGSIELDDATRAELVLRCKVLAKKERDK